MWLTTIHSLDHSPFSVVFYTVIRIAGSYFVLNNFVAMIVPTLTNDVI